MKKITVTPQGEETMVWYNSEAGAVVATVKKGWSSWHMEFQGREVISYHSKASAVSDARKKLKAYMKGGK